MHIPPFLYLSETAVFTFLQVLLTVFNSKLIENYAWVRYFAKFNSHTIWQSFLAWMWFSEVHKSQVPGD